VDSLNKVCKALEQLYNHNIPFTVQYLQCTYLESTV